MICTPTDNQRRVYIVGNMGATSVNSGNAGTALTTHENAAGFDVSFGGVIINTIPGAGPGPNAWEVTLPAGTYIARASMLYTSTAARVNIGIRLKIGANRSSYIGASAYIRNSSGHNEASSHTPDTPFTLTAPTNVGVNLFRLGASGTVALVGAHGTLSIEQI